MLNVENLSKSFGPQTLFKKASFSVGERARIGVVGPNGAGKSTFFRMLVGEEAQEKGEIRYPKQYRIAHMKQEWIPDPNDSIVEAALREHSFWFHAREKVFEFAKKLEKDHSEKTLTQYQEAETAFIAAGGYEAEPEVRELLTGLGFKEEELERKATELSGGWRIRCHLAGLLLQKADLLLLDEPTNHLDLETIVWLEDFLLSYPKAVMLISHDHRLISRIATDILEFAPPSLTLWPGGLKKYEELKKIRIEQLQATIANKEKEVQRLEDFVRRFRAKASKARQAQSRLKSSEHYQEELEALKNEMPVISKRPARFRLKLRERLPRLALEVENGQFGYEKEKPLFDLDRCMVEGGRKIGVIGVNGVGKSTFLKSCAGELPLLKGGIQRSPSITIGYFAQHAMEQLPGRVTVLDYLTNSTKGNTVSEIRGVAASLGLTADDVEKEISVLSGGEKARTTLSQILLSRPGLLLLDEPTNHLDLDACDALVKGLADYEGTVLVVSHNRDFLDSLVSFILEIEPGKATLFHGNYSDWLEQNTKAQKKTTKSQSSQSPSKKEKKKKGKSSADAKNTGSNSSEKKRKNRLTALEEKIEAYKTECKELEAKLCDPAHLKDAEFPEWVKRQRYLAQRVEQLENEWLELVES